MVIKIRKHGFSLTEVLVATIVMTMIMTGVLGFVQYGGEIWHKGQNKINAQNYSDMTFQLLKDDLLQAESISKPTNIGSSSTMLEYKLGGNDYEIKIDSSNSLIKTEKTTATVRATGSAAKPIRIARNVKEFNIYRVSTWTFEIGLQIQSSENEDEEGNIIEPEIISSESVVLLAPGVE